MSFYGLRLEYALEGSSNYISWKDKMEVVLEDNGLKEFIENDIPKSPTTDAVDVANSKKCVAKVRRIILEGVQDHIVLNIHEKDTLHAMWQALIDLFHNNSGQKKFSLKDKLNKIKMEKGDTIPQYLSRFTQCWDEIGSVDITIFEDDMLTLKLLGLPKRWHNY